MKILLKETQAEIEEKKSRFIACIKPVSNLNEAENFINERKKKYWDARHNCSAFIICSDTEITRCNDDGEPSGTAGRPMLEVLTHSDIKNVAVVVTRYFGGTLLGTGGLIRAYQEAVKSAVNDAISNGLIAEEIDGYSMQLFFSYSLLGKIQYYLSENKISIKNSLYGEHISFVIEFDKNNYNKLKEDLIELTKGQISFSDVEISHFCIPAKLSPL